MTVCVTKRTMFYVTQLYVHKSCLIYTWEHLIELQLLVECRLTFLLPTQHQNESRF